MKKLKTAVSTVLLAAATILSAETASIADIAKRAENGENLNVVFFGCSLTFGANSSNPDETSYRGRMAEKLRQAFPKAHWRFYDAAIGGTNSNLGVYRVDRDVLRHDPDLVFVDFTLNDGVAEKDKLSACYESILRKLLEKGVAVMPVYLTCKDWTTAKNQDGLLRKKEHIAMADYYKLPYGDVAAGMNRMCKEGKLDPEKIWPHDLFDTCHCNDDGYQIYADIIFDAFQKGAETAEKPVVPEKWITNPAYQNVKRIPLVSFLPQKGWRETLCETRAGCYDFLCSRWLDKLIMTGNCERKAFDQFEAKPDAAGEPLEFTFKAAEVYLFGESVFFGGKIKVELDGKEMKEIDAAWFGKIFGSSAYLTAPIASGLDPEKEHTLKLTPVFDKDQNQMLKLESLCIAGPGEIWLKAN